jgi:hypothetical protein
MRSWDNSRQIFESGSVSGVSVNSGRAEAQSEFGYRARSKGIEASIRAVINEKSTSNPYYYAET